MASRPRSDSRAGEVRTAACPKAFVRCGRERAAARGRRPFVLNPTCRRSPPAGLRRCRAAGSGRADCSSPPRHPHIPGASRRGNERGCLCRNRRAGTLVPAMVRCGQERWRAQACPPYNAKETRMISNRRAASAQCACDQSLNRPAVPAPQRKRRGKGPRRIITSVRATRFAGRGKRSVHRQLGCVGGLSIAATRFFTAFCTFSNARTSICRTRSRDTPNSSARSSSVIGSSASRRASKMRRSRSFSTESASVSALRRLSACSSATRRLSWLRTRPPASPATRPRRRPRGSAR